MVVNYLPHMYHFEYMPISVERPLSNTCNWSCRVSRLETSTITKGNVRVLHDMMDDSPTVEVPLIKKQSTAHPQGIEPCAHTGDPPGKCVGGVI